ncbi:ribokinase [Chthonomonas calidirosea]|uniref:ribokinase n=1 Tax=Chthonomonas calidirosea TaxID=454171 RepID=UPI0006DD46BF|nr:ribokinase [Chthonomonas calidirosea]CEK18606.1 ribokinase [Chthonomonas calidirosea]
MEFPITVVGSANVDMIMQVERFPAPGETVSDGQFSQAFGGKGANQAVAAARAGGRVAFLGCVGADAFGEAILENLRRDGIFTEPVVKSVSEPTGIAMILINKQGENCIAAAPGANNALTSAHIESYAAFLKRSRMVVIQAEIPRIAVEKTFEVLADSETAILFNFAPIRKEAPKLSPRITYLVVNETEAAYLSGVQVGTFREAEQAARILRRQGPQNVLLTLGANGVWVETPQGGFHAPALPVQAIDTTAAGDVFCGAFATATTQGQPIHEAVHFACAAAALCVTRLGAQPSIPYRAEVETLLKQQSPCS